MPIGLKDLREKTKASSRSGSTAPVTSGEEIAWGDVIPSDQWAIYRDAINAARAANIPFLVGGGFGLAGYTGRWRNTKDMDLYVLPEGRQRMIDVLTAGGFKDFYETLPYDRGWIYRSTRDGLIVDVIWSMANRRAEVDQTWFDHAKPLVIRDEEVLLVPPEELLWCKLYVFQRDHCDWTDAMNLIYAAGPQLDWDHLFDRLGPDLPVLTSLVTLFDWITPSRSAQLPEAARARFGLRQNRPISAEEERQRIRLLDTREWFAALQPKDKVLEV